MRATVDSSDLTSALKISVAATKTTMPVLMHALFTASEGRLFMETTDCEVYVRASIPAVIQEPGSVLMREALLRPVASVDGSIHLVDDGRVKRGRSNYRIPVINDVAQFPTQEHVKFEPIKVNAAALREAIRAVDYSGDEQKATTTATKALNVVPGRVWCTDGVQIGRVALDYDGPALAIPIYQVRRVIDSLSDDAKVSVGRMFNNQRASHLRIESDTVQVTMRLVDVVAPDIERILQNFTLSDSHRVVLKRQPLIAALRRFMPFAGWSGDKALANFVLIIEGTAEDLTIADRGQENREYLDDLVVEQGAPFRFGVDPKRMVDALNAIGTDTVEMYPPQENKVGNAMFLVPSGSTSDEVSHLLAPNIV